LLWVTKLADAAVNPGTGVVEAAASEGLITMQEGKPTLYQAIKQHLRDDGTAKDVTADVQHTCRVARVRMRRIKSELVGMTALDRKMVSAGRKKEWSSSDAKLLQTSSTSCSINKGGGQTGGILTASGSTNNRNGITSIGNTTASSSSDAFCLDGRLYRGSAASELRKRKREEEEEEQQKKRRKNEEEDK
jgi:hypothetical protein